MSNGSVNKVIIVGHLGKDPEVRYTANNQPVATLSIATNEVWFDKQGQKQERTEWHRVIVWGKLAELCKEYMTKGRQLYIEGRLQTRSWTDKDGHTRFTTEIQAQQIVFLGGGGLREGTAVNNQLFKSDTASSFNEELPTYAANTMLPADDQANTNFTEDDVPF